MMVRIFTILFFGILVLELSAQYQISGKVNLGDEWQPKLYLAAINKLNDYYRTSPDMILNTATVNADGSFLMQGDNIPADPRFYRLYAMKSQNTDYDACLYVGGDDHNFVHLILRNGEEVEINADPSSVAPFGAFEVNGSAENESMRVLSGLVYPSFYFYRIKFPTELKFSEDKFHADIKNFADSTSHLLPALAAINNMDWDVVFDQERVFFEAFGNRLKREFPSSVYTKNYLAKMRYYGEVEEDERSSFKWPFILSLTCLAACIVWVLRLQRKLKNNSSSEVEIGREKDAARIKGILTQKELEILELIHQGKSNKEIAQALFIELSTVKTHINKLYSKLGVSNRREAQVVADQLLS